jgi:GT2 family glycosyltransferase
VWLRRWATSTSGWEETDYLLRAIRAGFHLEYVPEIAVIHPSSDALDAVTRIKKDHKYAIGFGYVVRKNGLGFGYLLPHLVKPLLGAIYFALRLDFDNARARLCRLAGRWEGYFHPGGGSP